MITGFDIVTEVLVFALSIYLVINLQMPQRRKSVIIVAFGLRLL